MHFKAKAIIQRLKLEKTGKEKINTEYYKKLYSDITYIDNRTLQNESTGQEDEIIKTKRTAEVVLTKPKQRQISK